MDIHYNDSIFLYCVTHDICLRKTGEIQHYAIPLAIACILALKAVIKSFSRKAPDVFTAFIMLQNSPVKHSWINLWQVGKNYHRCEKERNNLPSVDFVVQTGDTAENCRS